MKPKRYNSQSHPDQLIIDAIAKGDYDFVQHLISKGAKLHTSSSHPLKIAVKHSQLCIIELLVIKGASQHIDNSVMNLAYRNGNVSIVDFLINNGACVDILTAFIITIRCGHLNMVKYLQEKYSTILNYADKLLLVAVNYNQYLMFDYLIKIGADIYASSRALFTAIYKQNYVIIEYIYKLFDSDTVNVDKKKILPTKCIQ